MVVFDDGRGFEAATIEAGRGLRTMRERAASTGGDLFIESSPSGGTTVIFETEIM
jgi:signal transduction histidine kinase